MNLKLVVLYCVPDLSEFDYRTVTAGLYSLFILAVLCESSSALLRSPSSNDSQGPERDRESEFRKGNFVFDFI